MALQQIKLPDSIYLWRFVFKSKLITISSLLHELNSLFLNENLKPTGMNHNLDKIDLKILKILQENAKITNLQLSGEIGLSPAPTLERVKKLETAKLIKGYYTQVNEEALGIGIKAVIQITLARQLENAISNFKKEINKIPEIMECYQVTGNADYILIVLLKDIRDFENLISQRLSKVEEIGQMQTMVILSKVKDSKLLPLDY
jgi:Lrp/AsnC family leucine-responsive transcriptional regulator